MFPSVPFTNISFPTIRYRSFRVEERLQISLTVLLNKTHICQIFRWKMKNIFGRLTVTSCGRRLPPVIRISFGILRFHTHTHTHTHTHIYLFNASYTYSNATLTQHFLLPVWLFTTALPGTRSSSNIPHRSSRDTCLTVNITQYSTHICVEQSTRDTNTALTCATLRRGAAGTGVHHVCSSGFQTAVECYVGVEEQEEHTDVSFRNAFLHKTHSALKQTTYGIVTVSLVRCWYVNAMGLVVGVSGGGSVYIMQNVMNWMLNDGVTTNGIKCFLLSTHTVNISLNKDASLHSSVQYML